MSPISTPNLVPLFRAATVGGRQIAIRMSSLDYQHAKIGKFLQEPPVLENPYSADPILPRILKQWLPASEFSKVDNDLNKFGSRIVDELDQLGFAAETNPPILQQYDGWGKRVDKVNVHSSWTRLKQIAAEEGLIGIAYDDESRDPVSRRLHQMAKIFMFHPSSGLVSCPMAMTDGASKTIKELGIKDKHPDICEAYERLISRDPSQAWTSGQWMTEKGGGSDVGGGCDTYARPIGNESGASEHTLHGYKWFSSAVDADVTLTLARPEVKSGDSVTATKGSKGLSLFFARVRNPNSDSLNGIQVVKLKNKLGTKQLPTAELLLDGVKALKVSEGGRGVASIANMLNITRIHNALCSASAIRRVVSLARDYAKRREAFGRKLEDWPLHLKELAVLELHARGTLLLAMEAARLLGIQESGRATPDELHLLRLVTTVVKLHAGKVCIPAISDGIESFGGQGYIEDTGIPNILRDAQITPIWEGTTNVLSLDVPRIFSTTKFAAVHAFSNRVTEVIKGTKGKDARLEQSGEKLGKAMGQFLSLLQENAQKDPEALQRGARDIAMTIGNIYTGALLTQFATHSEANEADMDVAHRYCVSGGMSLNLVTPRSFDNKLNEVDRAILYENYGKSRL